MEQALLHSLFRTGRTGSGSEIIVENNGTDFEPANDNEPHIALKNIQQRRKKHPGTICPEV